MADVTAQLEAIFQEVGKKHHEAFLETNGVDPEWPLCYADWLVDKLPPLLRTDLTKSELVYLLVHLSREQPHQSPDMPWSRYYAEFFARQYIPEASS
jgi:hypothetical protein